jgi:microcystin-dependent protein
VFYSDALGDVTELALGADGTFLKSNGATSAPTFATPAGSGDVSKVGTPVNNQVGVWTGDGTLEGDVDLTFDTATNTLSTVNIAVSGTVDGRDIATDGSKLDGIETGAEVNTIDTVTDTSEIDLTITARALTASIVAGSIDETKLDASVNASLDLADSALQSEVDTLQTVTNRGATTTNTTTFSPSGNNGAIVANGSGSGTGIDITHSGTGVKLNIGATGSGDAIRFDTDKFVVADSGNVSSSLFTASEILVTDASKNIVSAPVATYPSLTELSYVKGATSAIQTQLNAKQATLVSGTNIKTVNSTTLLGAGDLAVATTAQGALADSALQAANISDTAYDDTSWNGVTTIAPSKNAIRDKVNTMDSAIALNTAKVTNATHTGDVTGDTALTAQPALITGKSAATVATGDLVLIADINDSNNLKQVTAQSIADLATGGVSDGDKGDITVSASGATWTIDNDVVTFAKMQNISTDKLLGRSTALSGDVEEIACTSLGRSIISRTSTLDVRNDINAQENMNALAIITATVATDDKVIIQDTSASDVMRTVTTQAIANLAPIASVTDTNDVNLTITGTALSADLLSTAISAKTLVTPTTLDHILVGDESDSNNLKKVILQGVLDLFVPVGTVVPYAGTTEPSGWVFAYGQAVSRTVTYDRLFAVISTTYGVGDGSTTFNVPDLRGRVVAGQDDMGGSSANRLVGTLTGSLNGDTLGATGGDEGHLLTSNQSGLRSHSHTFSSTTATNTATGGGGSRITAIGSATGEATAAVAAANAVDSHNNVQPTIILNYMIKI